MARRSGMTIPQSKNAIRRALRELIDPEPDKATKERLMNWFENRCIYCDVSVEGEKRRFDHAVSEYNGGRNHASNRVLACSKCNDNEKMQKDWREFLKSKCTDAIVLAEKTKKIEGWMNSNPAPSLDAKKKALVEQSIADIHALIEERKHKITNEE